MGDPRLKRNLREKIQFVIWQSGQYKPSAQTGSVERRRLIGIAEYGKAVVMEYMGKQVWCEEPSLADEYRIRYVEGIDEYIQKMNRECKGIRRNSMPPESLKNKQGYYREKYKDMLGLDLFSGTVSKPVEMHYAGDDDVCSIYRLNVYITDEIPFYSMLLLPHGVEAPMPLVIAQHGGGGTPELCCDIYGNNNYNHMAQRALRRGAAILAPQLLLWSRDETATMRAHNIPYDRGKTDVDMKRFGGSITALEISGIMKTLDYVCGMKEIDEEHIAMIGLSYGGYFTLHTMAADTRIKAGYCAGVFNDRDIYDWQDLCYKGSAVSFQDAEAAALCAPRKLYIQVGKKDTVFDYNSALPEIARVYEYYAVFGEENNFRFSLWEGGHTVSDSDEGYDFIFGS